MPTVSELVRDVLASVATDATGVAAAKWIDNRYQEMVGKVKFRSLRSIGELQLPKVVGNDDDDTVTTTRDSTAVSGTSTTWETTPTTSPGAYWYFKASSAWYNISSVTDNTNLVLTTAFSEDAVSAGTYKIVKRYHPLASTARRLGSFMLTRLFKELQSVSETELNLIAPGRILTDNIPNYVALSGHDASDYLQVEIYPPPKLSEIIHYIYWKIPSTLSLGTTLPLMIDPYTLKEGVLVDLYRFEKAAALRAGNVEIAGHWGNEEARQRTIWRKVINDAIRSDRGVDDITMILDMISNRRGRYDGDITTAREDRLINWNG